MVTLRTKKVMKILVAFLVLGCLVPEVSAGKTKYTIVMNGEWIGDGGVKSLPVKLVAKVSSDGEGGLQGYAWIAVMFMLPDGTKIVYEHDNSGFDQLWVMNADGTNKMQLTFSDGNKEPDWQPICVPDIEAGGGEVIPEDHS